MAKSMYLLWGSGSSPCWRVMITLEEKKLQGYKQKLLSFEKQEHKSKEVLEINPRGQFCSSPTGDSCIILHPNSFSTALTKLPAFKHGDDIINESTGACLYLENQFKSQGNKLIPDNPAEQALMYQRMMEGLTLIEKLNLVTFYDFYVPEGERHDSALKRNKDNLVTELQLWESYLENVSAGCYLAGGFSLADVVVFPSIAYAFRYGLSAGRFPKLAKYYSLLKDRPSIKATWPPKWFQIEQRSESLKDI